MTITKKKSLYLLILLPVLVLAIFSFMQTKKQLVEKVYQERKSMVAVSANVLHEKLDRLNEVGVTMSSWPAFTEHYNEGKSDHAIELLKKIPKDYSYIHHALLTDTLGNPIDGLIPDSLKNDYKKIASKWYRGISKTWEPYLSEVYKDPAAPEMIIAALAVPVKDNIKKLKGILLLEINVKKLLEWSSNIKVWDSGSIYVIDQKGQLVVTPSYTHSTAILDYSSVPATQKVLTGEEKVEVLYNPVLHANKLTAYEKIPGYGWAVIAEQDASVLSSLNNGLWPMLLFFAFVIAMALFFAKQLIVAIEKQNLAREQLELLTHQINQANDAIYTLNSHHEITSWNQGAERMYGFTAKEVLGKNSDEILQTMLPHDEIKKARTQIESTHYWTGELQRKTKTGNTIYVQSSVSSIMEGEDGITGFVSVNFDITEQKKLQEQVNHLANIVEQSTEAIVSTDVIGKLISWNTGAENLFGYTKDEVIGKTVKEIGIVNLDKNAENEIRNRLLSEGLWQSEQKYLHKSGSLLDVTVTINIIKDQNGNATSAVFIIKDISQRKQLEGELKRLNEDLEGKIKLRTAEIVLSERKYRYLFENNPLPIWIIDKSSFKFLDVNKKAVQHYGYSREEFLGITALDIRPKDAREEFINKNFSSSEDDLDVDRGIWTHVKKDGTQIKVHISAIPIHFGTAEARLILAHDVTEQEAAKEKLAASEKRFRTLIENNTDIIVLMDEFLNIIYRSPAAVRITGWHDEDILNQPAFKNIHPDDFAFATKQIPNVLANPGKQFKGIFRNRHKNGHYLWMEGIVTNRLTDENVKAIVFNFHDITERKEAEEKLIESEQRYRTTLDSMIEGVQIIGFDWKYIYVNDALTKQSKYSKEQMIGHTVMELYPGVEQTPIFENCQRCMSERISIHCESEMLFADQSVEWFEQSFQPVPEGIFILSVNITERKKAEEKLKEQTAQLQTLSNNLPGVMIFQMVGTPEQKKYTYISNAVSLLTGNTAEEVLQDPMLLYSRILPQDIAAMLEAEKSAYESHSIFNVEVRFQSKADGIRWLNIISTPRKLNSGETVWDGFHVDITDRKNVAEAIKKSEEHYRLLVEQSADGIFLCDALGNCIAANTAGCKMLGYTYNEIITKNLSDAVAPEDQPLIAVEIMKIQDGSISSTEWNVHRKDGSIFIGEVISRILPEGRLQLILRDITERKESELRIKKLNEELEHRVTQRTDQLKKSNEEMEAFTYSVSHDLRAPLRGIIGFTSILEEEYSSKLDAEAMRLTSVIKNNTLKMGQLIDDLLRFSRISRHMLDKVAINTDEMVKQVIASPEIKNSIQNAAFTVAPLLETYGDLNTIRQVWINLISNALKYTSTKPEQRIEIGSYRLSKQVVFFIKDNGVGFEQAYSHKLFKVFQRLHSGTEFEGTGVGLAIVDKIITKHGGKVWAKGEVNNGATFYFSLPSPEIHT